MDATPNMKTLQAGGKAIQAEWMSPSKCPQKWNYLVEDYFRGRDASGWREGDPSSKFWDVVQHQCRFVSINNWSASTIGQHQQFVSINNWSASIIGQHQLFVSINNWSASTICQHQYQWRSISNQQSAAAVQIINQHQQFVSFYNYILTLQCESHIYLCKCFLTRDIWDRKRRIQYSPY